VLESNAAWCAGYGGCSSDVANVKFLWTVPTMLECTATICDEVQDTSK
jgi:hypothetical protein